MKNFVIQIGILIQIFMAFSTAWADNCSNIRLDRISEIIRHNPVSRQTGPNCYVHSASILLSGYIAQTVPNRFMVDVEAEVLTKSLEDLNVMSVENGIRNANTGRVCNTIQFVKNYCLANAQQESSQNNGLGWNVDMFLSKLNPFDRSRVTNILSACRRDVRIRESLANLPACENTDGVRIDDDFQLESPDTFKTTLHNLLDRSPENLLPISIEYCAGVLLDQTLSGITDRLLFADWNLLNSPRSVEKLHRDCLFHASAVVGRERDRNGQCYFIVQNSWGRNCSDYDGKCENGKIWVEESALSRNILRITNLNISN